MADIGSTLREARMRERIDISEVEAQTKIRAKYLRAIENEEWDLLPGPVYAKSFLRTYGDYLGLDSRMLVDEYRRRYERPTDHELRPIGTFSRERERERERGGPLLPPWALIGIVLIGVVVVLFVVGSLSGSKKSPPTATVQVNKPRHRRRHRRAAVLPAAPRTVRLQLVPTGTVYVCLVDGAGTKLIDERTFSAGQTVPVASASKLLLTLGNNAVQLKVDGKPQPVAPSPNAIRLLID